ncbi:DUF4823 domain-containing protein [Celerinatantimonas sp. YJH-8]|uniref:DUF4823 domain-containing protein n=1 Tax=Celerinatantimonas sp. YJH-8 TaxID=3228714 RepID=UPI0038C32E33
MFRSFYKIALLLGLALFTTSGWTAVLKANQGVFISQVRQAINGPKQNQERINSAALALQQAFKAHTKHVLYSPSCSSVDCLAGPKIQGYSYYVSPQFVFWDNQAANGAGQKDVPELKIAIYDVASRQVIATQIISSGSSSVMIGGSHTEHELLSGSVKAAIDAFYKDPS